MCMCGRWLCTWCDGSSCSCALEVSLTCPRMVHVCELWVSHMPQSVCVNRQCISQVWIMSDWAVSVSHSVGPHVLDVSMSHKHVSRERAASISYMCIMSKATSWSQKWWISWFYANFRNSQSWMAELRLQPRAMGLGLPWFIVYCPCPSCDVY